MTASEKITRDYRLALVSFHRSTGTKAGIAKAQLRAAFAALRQRMGVV